MPVLLSFLLGIFSMGFQLLGSRMLSPWFGSSVIVWAFIISVFLAGFSLGSIGGGLLARLPREPRARAATWIAALAVAGFALNAVFAGGFLAWLDRLSLPLPLALGLTCGLLFLPPVGTLAALTPLLVQHLHERGRSAGFASGLISCTSTLGNIAGIMLTAFFFIPLLPISTLLGIWTAGVAIVTVLVCRCLRS